jgi:hypothetical protein
MEWVPIKPCKGDAGLLHRPYRAWINSTPTQGSGRFASSTPGCAVPRFQRWDR